MYRRYSKLFDQEVVTIFPAEVYVTRLPEVISTVLGSCISVCICDTVNKVCGMNHFMLPINKADDFTYPRFEGLIQDKKNYYSEALRYGSFSMECLIGELQKAGGERKHMKAKVFGGANVMSSQTITIGKNNTDFVLEYLAAEKIPVLGKDVLGSSGRHIYFVCKDFKIFLKALNAQETVAVSKDEEKIKPQINQVEAGDVELF